MLNIKQKIATAAATAVILSSVMSTGAFAADGGNTIKIRGNGAGSTNIAKIKNKKQTTVTQTNATAVVNLVGVFQNTGGNKANNNTGDGNVKVDSGAASATVTNTTNTGSNTATVDPCGCPTGDSHIVIRGNGAGSTNEATVVNKSEFNATQTNETLVVNGVLVAQNTGGNTANNNTGDGGVDVDSGNATATVTNTTTTGGNTLNP